MAEEKTETKVEKVVKEPEAKTEEKPKEEVKKPKAEAKEGEREYYRTHELAKKFNYRTAWISYLCKIGRIKAIQAVGGQWHIPKEEFEMIVKRGKLPKKRAKPSPVIDIVVPAGPQDKVAPKIPEEKTEEVKKPVGFPRFWK